MAIGQDEIGRRIKQAREDADLTQQQLADRIGIETAQSVSRYERAETEVSTKRLRKIAEATGKSMDYFVQDPDEMAGQANPTEFADLQTQLEELRAAVGRVEGLLRDAFPDARASS